MKDFLSENMSEMDLMKDIEHSRLQELTDFLQICFLKAKDMFYPSLNMSKLWMANSGSTWGWKLLGGVQNLKYLSLECRPVLFILKTFSSLIMLLEKMINITS